MSRRTEEMCRYIMDYPFLYDSVPGCFDWVKSALPPAKRGGGRKK